MKRTNRFAAEPLDLTQTVHRHTQTPLVYCTIALNGRVQPARLRMALALFHHTLPQMLCAYSPAHNEFVEGGHTIEEAVQVSRSAFSLAPVWDVTTGPQLRVHIERRDNGDTLTFAASHILCDAHGLLQLVYAVCGLYNTQQAANAQPQNIRDIACILRQAPKPAQPAPAFRAHSTSFAFLPFVKEASCSPAILTTTLGPAAVAAIRRAAKAQGATFNDALLAALARVLAGYMPGQEIHIACPADLRHFAKRQPPLTIANMTGMYHLRLCPAPGGFAATLRQVHAEMARLKNNRACFWGIGLLRRLHHFLPQRALQRLLHMLMPLPPVSLTNIGVVDAARLRLEGCTVQGCFVTGSYKNPPFFQIAATTFKGSCTLAVTLQGGPARRALSEQILHEATAELNRLALAA